MTSIAVVKAGTAGTTIPVAAKNAAENAKASKKFRSGMLQYKVTSLKEKKGAAARTGTKASRPASVSKAS